jgi:hypothetical protein
VAWNDWILDVRVEPSFLGTRGRLNKQARPQTLVVWRKITRNVRAGSAWIRHAAFVPVDAQEFHPIVLSLARKLVKAQLPRGPPTLFIFALHDSFAAQRVPRALPIDERTFRGCVPGYLRLELGREVPGDCFEVVVRRDERYSILRGCYVSPWACSILRDNEIDGLMLDTTWHVLRQYVTAIVMAVYCNVGIPLAFAFGVAETKGLYEQLYAEFMRLFQIDLSKYIVLSDQGTALRALCDDHHQRQLFCLRHFLRSLKMKTFSLAVGNLVKCRTEDEFHSLRRLYEGQFRAVVDAAGLKLLKRTLNKAGRGWAEGEIVIEDEVRWNVVSMWRRIPTRLPSTTNSLEATHGHLNEAISRRNPFWQSMGILYGSVSDKVQHFDVALVQGFRLALKRYSRRCRDLPKERMDEECMDFGTSIEACSCGETVHLSSCYRTDIPCGHRYAKGARKPETPRELALKVKASTREMEYSEGVHDRVPAPGWDGEELGGLKSFACEQIKRFSGARNGKAVRAYVTGQHIDLSGPSALDIPLSLHRLITCGIMHFRNLSSRG